MNKIIVLLMIGLILIIGCTKEIKIIEYINTTSVEYETKEVYIESEPVIQIQECNESLSQDYVDRVIRDYNRCSYELDSLNNSDLRELVYDLNISLRRCENKT